MAKKRRAPAKQIVKRAPAAVAESPASTSKIPAQLQEFLEQTSVPKGFVNPKQLALVDLRKRVIEINVKPTVPLERLLASVNRIKPAPVPMEKLPDEIKASVRALRPELRRFHGAKIALSWFPFPWLTSSCADRFGYMSSAATRAATRLPFNVATQTLLNHLGDLMGNPGRDPNVGSHNPADAGVSSIPAGFTYFGQFVDHDITLDVSSSHRCRHGREHDQQHAKPEPGSGFCVRSRTRPGPFPLLVSFLGSIHCDQVPDRHEHEYRPRWA